MNACRPSVSWPVSFCCSLYIISVRGVISTIELDDLLLAQESEDFTFFAPSDAAMDEFLSSLKARQSAGGWHSMYFLLEFLNFHSIDSAYSLEALKSYSGILQSYPTLYDGFSLYTVNINSSLKIVVNHSKFANFVVNDILTTNGLIHIIDKVLEPFLPDANKPSVEDSLRENPEYSKFYNLLQSTGVLPELSEMDEFTLFVPTNDAFGPIHQRLSANALRYYIVPSLVFTPSVYNRQRLETLLGPRHQLEINLFDNLVLVNKQQVTMPDVLVDGGVLHQLDKLLHPVLNWCNATDIVVDEGPCVDCSLNVTDLPCPYDMSPFVPARIRHFHCRYPSPLGGPDMVGCQQICGLVPTKPTCCAGYFGQHCEECPGGAEFPCSRRGTCFDGSTGNGTCMCDSGFSGLDCSQCENPSMALPNCNTTHPTCKTGESGCHEHAACKVNPLGPAHCTCKTGYHGNGQWCRENVNGCLTEQYGGCDRSMRASCHYQPPDVTELQDNKPVCQCQAGYEGNGTLCSQDMLDLVSRLPALTYFRSKMDQVDVTNITKLMQSLTQNITLFAPLSENYAALKLSDLIVQGQNLWLPENLTSTEAVGQAEEGIAPSQLLQINEVTALGGQEINITAGESGQLYANNVPIVERNIVTQNGLLHLTESPISSFSAVQVSPSHSRGKSNSTVVAVCVVVIIVAIIIVVVVAVLLVKSRKKGGFKLFNRSRSTEGSDTSVSFARLNAHDEDDASLKGSDAPKYDNPIFDDPDIM
ncbi:hypothetical protein RRG08_056324 [Elysia crispata]|uniref:Stabilin-2-like n=1 Tax=Elysia crispata TaxID=231223 RepID=A0AAE0YPD9_9GAST|nr:hypothetical protein RRG08_056324 [Elysia crispata]